jgi:hypothetical protein
MDFECDGEAFIGNIALMAMHFCKPDACYSEKDLAKYSPIFPEIMKCLLQQGHIELLKLQSFGGSGTDFMRRVTDLFLLDVPEDILLPHHVEPFFEAESATWIGILDDLFMWLADPLSRFINYTRRIWHIVGGNSKTILGNSF